MENIRSEQNNKEYYDSLSEMFSNNYNTFLHVVK